MLVLLLAAGCGSSSPSPGNPATPPPGGGGTPQPAGTMTRGPYLQHSDSGVTVVWYTGSPSEGRVRWEDGEGATGEAVSGARTSTRHEAVMSPLAAAARYAYRVYSAEGLLAGADGTTQFSFRAPEPEVLRLVVFGDCGQGTPGQLAVARAIAAEPAAPDLALIVGDVVYPPADDATYDPWFFAPYRALLATLPFYATPGNHDYEVQAGQPFFDVFTLPRNGPPAARAESSWWLERAGALLIAHDTNQSIAALRASSVPWHVAVARRPAAFRLVFQHHAMFSSGPGYSEPPSPSLRQLLAPVYTATGVDVVFNGHDHLYERTRPQGGVVYVTTGAGGADLYARQATNDFTEAFSNDRHSYTYVEVRGRTLLLRQTDADGLGIDALALTKPVAATDALRAFSGPGGPPGGWSEPGFDDSAWPEAAPLPRGSPVRARRGFHLPRPDEAGEAFVRVRGVRDYVVYLNGARLFGGEGRDEAAAAFPVAVSALLRGANALALEGKAEEGEGLAPSLELTLVSSPGR